MSLSKRKLDDTEHFALADPPNHKMQKLNIAQATAASSPKKPFCFLDLAPELCNKIYSSALEDYPSRLSNKNENPQLQTDCPLICVSKQVSSEIKSLLVTDTRIQTVALDFNFEHIMTFFNNLSKADFMDYVKSSDLNGRFLKVELTFTVPDRSGLPVGELRTYIRWRQWISERERGVAVKVTYAYEVDADMVCYEKIIPALVWEEDKKRDEKKEH